MRSPHASHLHPRWSDPEWKAKVQRLGATAAAAADSPTLEATAPEESSGSPETAQTSPAKPKPAQTQPTRPSLQVQVLRPVACRFLGKVVKHAGSCCPRKNTHVCDAGQGNVQPASDCEKCDMYAQGESDSD